MIRYLTLAEYMWLAEQVTGVDANVLAKSSRSDLADLALHAPQAGFGEEEFYPDIFDKAAALVCRLTWNHPLIDGNKRAAWAALVMNPVSRPEGIPKSRSTTSSEVSIEPFDFVGSERCAECVLDGAAGDCNPRRLFRGPQQDASARREWPGQLEHWGFTWRG